MENEKFKLRDSKIELELFNQKYLKKYLFSIAAIGIGLFMGGVVTLGIFAGLFAAVGTALSIDRLKETFPQGYNWMIDHPGWVEIITTIGFAGAFGLTATGIVGGLVANILSSVVIDYYAEQEGRIEGVEALSFSAVFKQLFMKIKDFFVTVKNEVVLAVNDLRGKKELVTVENEATSSDVASDAVVLIPEVA